MSVFLDTYRKLNKTRPIAFIHGMNVDVDGYMFSFNELINHFNSTGYKENKEYKVFIDSIKTPFDKALTETIKSSLNDCAFDMAQIVIKLYQEKIINIGTDEQNRIISETLYETLIEYAKYFPIQNMNEATNIVTKWYLMFLAEAINGLEAIIYVGKMKKHNIFFLKWLSKLGVRVILASPNVFQNDNLINEDEFYVVSGKLFKDVNFYDNKINPQVQGVGIEVKSSKINILDIPLHKDTKVVSKLIRYEELVLDDVLTDFETSPQDRVGYLPLPSANFKSVFMSLKGYPGNSNIEEYLDKFFLMEERLKMKNVHYERRKDKILPIIPSEVQKHPIKGETLQETMKQLDLNITSSDEYNKHIYNSFLINIEDYIRSNTNQSYQTVKNFIHKLYVWVHRESYLLKTVSDCRMGVKLLIFNSLGKYDLYHYRLLALLGIDVLLIFSNKDVKYVDILTEEEFIEFELSSGNIEFPSKRWLKRKETVTKQASETIKQILYNGDTGTFKPFQLEKHKVISLPPKTTFEEIRILWKEQARFRPGFEVHNGAVIIPNLFCKIDGINENQQDYYDWLSILKEQEGTLLFDSKIGNDIVMDKDFYQLAFLINDGKIDKKELRSKKEYMYDYLKLATQEMMINKLQELIDSKSFINPLEKEGLMIAIKMFLTLPEEIVMAIEQFDYPHDIPKLIISNDNRDGFSLADILRIVYLSSIGFDVLILTGSKYRNIERFVNQEHFDRHELAVSSNEIDIFKNIQKEEKKSIFGFLKSK